jgi:uncharacterized membrane protein
MEHLNKIKKNTGNKALLSLRLWPNRSLSKKDFVSTICFTSIGILIPIIPFIGTVQLFAILPFSLGTLLLLIIMIKLNYKSGKLYEKIRIETNLITVKRFEPNGIVKTWNSNPYWTKIKLYKESEKVENYLTLSGNGKEIEIGSFLAPKERLELKRKIEMVITNI